jgi:hypothetical protein
LRSRPRLPDRSPRKYLVELEQAGKSLQDPL